MHLLARIGPSYKFAEMSSSEYLGKSSQLQALFLIPGEI